MTDTSKRSRTQEDDLWEDSAPSRLDKLTSACRLAERERNAAGWRRNLLVMGVATLVAALITVLAAR